MFDRLMVGLNRIIGQQMARRPNQAGGAGAPAPEFRKQPGDRPTYVLDLPPGLLPPQLAEMFQPTVSLGKDGLVLAATTAAADRGR